MYEYGDLGILKTELPSEPTEDGHKKCKIKSKYPAFSLKSVEKAGPTHKTQKEFEDWVEEQNQGDFQ